MTSTLSLFCYARGQEKNSVFQIKIDQMESVAALKDAIKEKNKNTFRDFDAQSLILWNVPVPYGRNLDLREEVEKLNLIDYVPLDPLDILSEILTLPEKSVHIIIGCPPLGEI